MYKYFTIESREYSKIEKDSYTIFLTTSFEEAVDEFNNCLNFCAKTLDSKHLYKYILYGWISNRENKVLQMCDNLYNYETENRR